MTGGTPVLLGARTKEPGFAGVGPAKPVEYRIDPQ
jgi:hypothetical protein